MKTLILLLVLFGYSSVFGQDSTKKIIAQTQDFFIMVDTNWVKQDSMGEFTRIIEIETSSLTLTMVGNGQSNLYPFLIEKLEKTEEATLYFCRDYGNLPMIVELSNTSVGLYYYYDEQKNSFKKAENLLITSYETVSD